MQQHLVKVLLHAENIVDDIFDKMDEDISCPWTAAIVQAATDLEIDIGDNAGQLAYMLASGKTIRFYNI